MGTEEKLKPLKEELDSCIFPPKPWPLAPRLPVLQLPIIVGGQSLRIARECSPPLRSRSEWCPVQGGFLNNKYLQGYILQETSPLLLKNRNPARRRTFPLDLNFLLSPPPGPTQVCGKLSPKQSDPMAEQRAEGVGWGDTELGLP